MSKTPIVVKCSLTYYYQFVTEDDSYEAREALEKQALSMFVEDVTELAVLHGNASYADIDESANVEITDGQMALDMYGLNTVEEFASEFSIEEDQDEDLHSA